MISISKTCGDEKRIVMIPHIPKTGGSYIKSKIKNLCEQNKEYKFQMHNQHQSIFSCFDHSGDTLLFELEGDVCDSTEVKFLPILRDPFSWYDSYFYYRRSYADRKHTPGSKELYPAPPEPFNAAYNDDYKNCLMSSFSEKFMDFLDFSVLGHSFVPSAWMKTFDVGIYSAWILYTFSYHPHVFVNAEKFKCSSFLEHKDLWEPIGDVFVNSVETSNIQSLVPKFLNEVFEPREDIVFDNERINEGNYKEDHTTLKSILSEDSALRERFFWKERLALQLCEKSFIRGK